MNAQAAAVTMVDLEGQLAARRATIMTTTEELVAALRVFPNCHNFRAGDLRPTWWILRAVDRERASVGTERVREARLNLEELLADEARIIDAINRAKRAQL
jgi:hypothetical protein